MYQISFCWRRPKPGIKTVNFIICWLACLSLDCLIGSVGTAVGWQQKRWQESVSGSRCALIGSPVITVFPYFQWCMVLHLGVVCTWKHHWKWALPLGCEFRTRTKNSHFKICIDQSLLWWQSSFAWHIPYFTSHSLFYLIHSFCFALQVCADDVLTKEEQIGLLFRAKRKCEGIIKAKHKVPGKWEVAICVVMIIIYSLALLWGWCRL